MKIRKATAEDARPIFDIRIAAIRHQCTGHYSEASLDMWTSGEMSDKFVDWMAAACYVAIIESAIVGTGILGVKSGQIDAVFVHPDHMGNGIAREMMRHLEHLAVNAGLTQMTLDSTLNAAAFYRKCGFVGDTMSTYVSKKGISLDCIPMLKHLPATKQTIN
jgi:GNAT superfamily N-acetyltransferase